MIKISSRDIAQGHEALGTSATKPTMDPYHQALDFVTLELAA